MTTKTSLKRHEQFFKHDIDVVCFYCLGERAAVVFNIKKAAYNRKRFTFGTDGLEIVLKNVLGYQHEDPNP